MISARPGILFAVSSLCFGGAEKHTVSLLNRLETGTFRLSLAYLKPDESLLPQLDTRRLDAVLSCNVQSKLDWRVVRTLAAFIERYSVDVIVCSHVYPTLYALLAGMLARRRVALVEVFHTTLPGSFKDKVQLLLYRAIFRRFDLLVFVSRNQQTYWRTRRLRARNDCVIYNGIDIAKFEDSFAPEEKLRLRAQLGFTADDYVAGICAALRPEKAHGDFLRALARARSMGVAVKGLIIGDGPERARIEALIDALRLRDSVVMTGFRDDVKPYVACCDVVTLASHSVETFSVAALEAMALSKPLILSRVGGADEQVTQGENGLLFEPGDIEAFAQHLVTLSSIDARNRMGRASLARVRSEFTESRMIQEFSNRLTILADAKQGNAVSGFV